ncbi:MAG TPA: hypothetical protein PLV68_21135, partial [Ilumatobacteraceae bacterium]|nr:hypothetical protein [Ilumatobacteraceae bacterium]
VLGDHSRPGWELAAIGGILVTLAATVVLATAPAQDLEHRELAPLLDPLLDAMPDPAPDPTFGPAPDPDD